MTYDDAGSGARTARTGTTDRRGAWTVRGTRSRRASISVHHCRAAYHDALDARAGRASGSTLPAAARAAIDGHVRLLLAWNPAINLTAIRDPAAIAIRHVVDSLTAPRRASRRAASTAFVDLGSGGGFPGTARSRRPCRPTGPCSSTRSARRRASSRPRSPRSGSAITWPAEAVRAETLAADRRDRERWPAVTARAVGVARRAGRARAAARSTPGGVLVAWKREWPVRPGSARSSRRPGGRSTRSIRAGGSTSSSRSPPSHGQRLEASSIIASSSSNAARRRSSPAGRAIRPSGGARPGEPTG